MPLTQRTRVRSAVVSVFLVEVSSGDSSTVRQMSGKVGPHLSPDIIYHRNHQIISYECQFLPMLTYVYLGLRARQHLRSLAPVMK